MKNEARLFFMVNNESQCKITDEHKGQGKDKNRDKDKDKDKDR
jgi:hypothetical protein